MYEYADLLARIIMVIFEGLIFGYYLFTARRFIMIRKKRHQS